MRKALKIIAILLGVVIGLLVLVAVALTILVDPNRYRDDIVAAVKAQTGRDLTIEGDLRLSFFPWIGLKTGRLVLANAPGFGPEPFAVVGGSEIKVELWPLLRQQVVVDAVRLNGLRLNLARNKKGRTNWEDLAKSAESAEPPPTTEEPGAGAALAAFTINRFEIRDSEATWRDEAAGAAYAVRNLELTSANVLGAEPAPLRFAFDLESKDPPIRERVQLEARARFDAEAGALDLPELTVTVGDVGLQAQLRGTRLYAEPVLAGGIEVSPFDARALLGKLGVDYLPADEKALRKVALRAQLQHDPRTSALSNLQLTLDETQLTGKLALHHKPETAYRFELAVDSIDVDRYLPPPTAPDPQQPERSPAEAAVVPVALLRETNAEGTFRAGKLKAFGVRAEDMVLKVNARNGRIDLGPNQAKLYGGTYSGRTLIDASGRVPQFRMDEKLTGVQLGPLLKDAQVFDRYSGTGNVSLNLTAQGLDAKAITRTLSGTVTVAMRDGKIEGVNLQKIVQQARAALDAARGREVQAATEPSDETAFKSLTATARITKGVARNDDLKLDGPVVRATGSGTADLVKETLDYRLQVTVAEGADRQGTTVPVRVRGPFAGPSYSVDVSALLREQTKPLQQKLEKKLDQELQDGLERLRQKLRR